MPAKTCLFCASQLDGQTKPEHILLNVLGGRMTSRSLICSDCNNRFGSSIDAAVANQVGVFRSLLQLPTGDGKPPPILKRVNAGDDVINIRNDGRPELVQAPFTIEDNADGTANVRFSLRTMDDLPKHMAHAAAALGKPVDHLLAGVDVESAVLGRRRPGIVQHSLQFGGTDFLRSIAKSALELWAVRTSTDEVQSAPYAAARDFVVNGGDQFNRTRTEIDDRNVPQLAELTERFGPVFNLLYIRSSGDGRVIAHFTLYNVLGWQIVLAGSGGAPNCVIGIASNALDPSQWSRRVADDLDIPFDWLAAPEYDPTFVGQTARIGAAIQLGHDRGVERELARIVDEEWRRLGLAAEAILDEPAVKQLSARIADRAARLLLDIRQEERIDPDRLSEIIASIRRTPGAEP